MQIKPLQIFFIAIAIIFIGIGIYKTVAYEKMAYDIRQEDAAMKEEATRVGLEKAATADRMAP